MIFWVCGDFRTAGWFFTSGQASVGVAKGQVMSITTTNEGSRPLANAYHVLESVRL